MPPRLSHKKTRTGCQRCKVRKVKCNEEKPACAACQRHETACIYDRIPEHGNERRSHILPPEQPYYTPPESLTHSAGDVLSDDRIDHSLELRLMHYWTAHACKSFTTAWQFWYYQVPLIALDFRYTMDAMLAVSALHASKQGPTRWLPLEGRLESMVDTVSSVPTPNSGHWKLNERQWEGYNAKMQASTLDKPALEAAAAIRSQEMLMISRIYFNRALEGHRKAVADLTKHNIEAVYVTSVLVSHNALYSLGQEDPDKAMGINDPILWMRLSSAVRLICERWSDLVGPGWIASSGVFFAAPDMSDEAELFNPDHSRSLSELLTWASEYETLSVEDRDVYQKALSYIGLMLKCIREGTDTPLATCRRVFAMPARLPLRFTALVEQSQPRAMIMLAYVFACLKLIDEQVVWFRGVAERQIPLIHHNLPVGWQALMEWPMAVADGNVRHLSQAQARTLTLKLRFANSARPKNCYEAIERNHFARATKPHKYIWEAMGGTDREGGSIRSIAILGDNCISASIIKELSDVGFDLHQIASPRTEPEIEVHLTIHKSDLDGPALTEVFTEIKPDILISTSHGGSFETQRQIIDAAIDAKVPRFVPAEFGHDSLNEKLQDRLPPLRERARTIQYLQSPAISGHISWVAVATGCLLDHGLQSGNLGFDLQWQSATLHGGGHECFPASSSAWIGHVTSSIVQRWDQVRDQYFYAAGLTTSGNEIVATLEKASGKKWAVGRADVQECVQEAKRRIERGWPDAGMFLMERSIMYDESLGAVTPFVAKDAKQRLGMQAEGLDHLVEDVLHQHKHHGKGDCGCE